MRANPQVPENGANLGIDRCNTNNYIVGVKKKAKEHKKPEPPISFRASQEDKAIIEAGMKKHGLGSASDILRMALRRFKEHEGLEVAS